MPTKPLFENVLVTGASGGIGEAVVVRLAQLGAKRIFFCGRDAARCATVEARLRALGADAHGSVLDVAQPDAVRAWLFECDAQAPLDLVYANAGVSTSGREDAEDAVRRVFEVNVTGVLNTIYPVLELYARPRADGRERLAKRLALTSSMTGYHGMPQCPAYSASKACVKALGFALRGRWRSRGIVVTTICPGFVRSRITDQNTCPMPFFMEAPAAARRICAGIAKGRGLVTFPWPMRLGMWCLSSLPDWLSGLLFRLLPEKNSGSENAAP